MAPPSAKQEAKSIPTARKTGGGGRHPHEQALRCPRCDSTNTKFCYYNNYSLAQPRHFCKTCRRYWTLGGALRNVPIGGGCRKTKKPKPSISPLSGDTKGLARPPGTGGLEFFHTLSPAVDIQMGGHDFPGIPPGADLPGPFPSAVAGNHWVAAGFQEMGGLNCQNSLVTSSIESLSFINQDLHWKLQRQRLNTLFSGDDGNQKKALVPNQKNQPALFQNMDISKKPDLSNRGFEKNNEGGILGINIHNIGLNSTDWFFDNSFQTVAPAAAPVSGNVSGSTSNWSNGIQDLY